MGRCSQALPATLSTPSIFNVKQPLNALGSLGVWRDQFAHELPMAGNPPAFAWSLSRNMRFRDGYAQKCTGQAAIFDPPSVVPYWLLPITNGSTRYLVYAGATKIYTVTGTTHSNITRQTAGNDVNYTGGMNTWNGCVLTGIAIINNGVDVPQFWAGNPATRCAALTNWPAAWTARSVRAHKQFLFALSVTKTGTTYPHLVHWSHPAEPGTVPSSWDDSDPELDAGRNDLADDESKLVDGLTLGDVFVIYKEASIWVAQYIGGQSVFNFRKITDAAGLLAPNGLVAFPGGHVFIAQGDVMLFTGIGEPQSILAGRLQKYFVDTIDSTAYAQSFCCHNPTQNEVWVCYPTAGATYCDEAIIWNYKNDTLGIRALPNAIHGVSGVVDSTIANSWNADTDSWLAHERSWNGSAYTPSAKRLMLASSATKIYLADLTSTFAGTAFSAYVRREGMDFGDPDAVKTITSVRPRFDAPAGTVISVRVGGSMYPGSGITWSAAVDFTVGTSDKVDTFTTGRYLALQFETSSASTWRIKSADIEFEVTGGN